MACRVGLAVVGYTTQHQTRRNFIVVKITCNMKMAMKEGTTGNDEKSLKLRTLENKTCCAQYGMAYHNVETSYFIQLKMCYLMTYHGLTATRHIIGHLAFRRFSQSDTWLVQKNWYPQNYYNYNQMTTQKPKQQFMKTMHKTKPSETIAWFRSPFTYSTSCGQKRIVPTLQRGVVSKQRSGLKFFGGHHIHDIRLWLQYVRYIMWEWQSMVKHITES